MWCQLIWLMWTDAVEPRRIATRSQIMDARRWFAGRDFITVCALAGVDPDPIRRAYQAALAGAEKGRAA
ncbi:MAG TPA: hypothetical protein DIT40_08940 [Alphaproteobacteria bacterium]|nr:hypothetical protein [Alphaproteobacteria bacterium]